jgi:hypothetical protein
VNPYARVYRLTASPDTLLRSACEDAGCAAHRHGWESTIDEATDLGRAQAAYIRRQSGRTFTEHRSGALTVFRFGSGQRCFAEHRTRPQRFAVYEGMGLERQHVRAADWLEDCGEHLDRVVTRERG